MHQCQHCGYRFESAADLARHQNEVGGCPDAP